MTCPSSATPAAGSVFTPTYRDIAHKAPRSRRVNLTCMQVAPTGENCERGNTDLRLESNDAAIGQLPICDDDFTIVKNKKRKLKINNLRGTLESTGKIQVVESQCYIYVSRVTKSVTASDIIDHITDRGEKCSKIEILKQFKETNFNSFKVTIPTSKIDTFLNTNFWPVGLVYRRYRERKGPAVFNKLNG
ncbi:jg7543 [Pararge aegeria aegeria]|uniref:Jg7543 protein n=1 Tax=Pararge aegeria aegeria TaxID=348720 RepID=A0A8S4S3H3_9NEOP|nr:jg7543 [Pararge aegeria aegeria]